LDELAGTAAERSAALQGDVAKGARARKKKALSDFLKALNAAGASRLRSDVPPGAQWAASLQRWLAHSVGTCRVCMCVSRRDTATAAAAVGNSI
jgi:hypothetical protein